jgi:hypothetical protein
MSSEAHPLAIQNRLINPSAPAAEPSHKTDYFIKHRRRSKRNRGRQSEFAYTKKFGLESGHTTEFST